MPGCSLVAQTLSKGAGGGGHWGRDPVPQGAELEALWGGRQEGGNWYSGTLSFHSVVITVVLIRASKWFSKSNSDILQEGGSEQSSPLLKVTQQQCRESPAHGSGLRSSVSDSKLGRKPGSGASKAVFPREEGVTAALTFPINATWRVCLLSPWP